MSLFPIPLQYHTVKTPTYCRGLEVKKGKRLFSLNFVKGCHHGNVSFYRSYGPSTLPWEARYKDWFPQDLPSHPYSRPAGGFDRILFRITTVCTPTFLCSHLAFCSGLTEKGGPIVKTSSGTRGKGPGEGKSKMYKLSALGILPRSLQYPFSYPI